MDTNEYTYPRRKSPYADSPYECAWTASVEEIPAQEPAKEKHKGGFKLVTICILLILACVGTAFVTSALWQGKMDRMSRAMDEKFAALKQLYSESQSVSATPLPQDGPLTPAQVYAQNVDAVVVVNQQGRGVGSGFLISADGYIITNYHVISDSQEISVTTHSGKTVKATIIGSDSVSDVALLKAEGEKYPFVTLGSSAQVAVGDRVCAIGNPLGELNASLSVGYISARDRVVSGDTSGITLLQTDAAINSGNSGGPLFNAYGQVVGIISAKYAGSAIEGLGFAIPLDEVKNILSDLQTHGYVTGAYLGVYVEDVNASAQAYGMPAGAYIQEAIKGYCAEKGGIKAGDIIINLGGYDVDSLGALTGVLRRFKAGDTVSVTVYRAGKQEYFTVTLDEKPAPQQTPASPAPTTPSTDSFENFFDDLYPFF